MKNTINSEIVHEIKNSKFGSIGYLVVDRLIQGMSIGGVRIVPAISLLELQHIARSMTYKNVFINNRIGGAKGAVIISCENEKHRNEILFEFGKGISPFVKRQIYSPGMDIGITPKELQIIYNGAGVKRDVLSWKNLSHEYSAYSCFYATLAAVAKKNLSIQDVTFSIQGFGSLGSIYADLMTKAGARLTAVSNIYGGLVNENGFNIGELLHNRSAHGDKFILSYAGGQQVSHDVVLEKDVTVLMPAANSFAISDENWEKIRANIIVSAANCPFSYDIERRLFRKGKIVITDFVANCGGVLGSVIDTCVAKNDIVYIFSNYYKNKVETLLNQSLRTNTPMVDIVITEVEKNIERESHSFLPSKKLLRYPAYALKLILKLMPDAVNKWILQSKSQKHIHHYERLWK